ncbi:MAG TPA: DoxX family protein [Actinomycetota bacterium]|nr:DoxX family protein [Actinomycetota bacterium]
MDKRRAHRADRTAVRLARAYGILSLRISLGLVFVWFGALKVFGVSPVAGLVADMIPVVPDRTAVVLMGAIEIGVGIGLLTGWLIRVTLGVFFAQMLGTFLVFVARPSLSFAGGNPLELTVLGEFILKNLVLITAGIVVAAATIPRPQPDEGLGEMLTKKAESERAAS